MMRVLWWLIAGTRCGLNRARIIMTLKDMPANANQLAESLDLDYKTVRHYLDLLVENQILVPQGEGYGMVYFLTSEMEANYSEFEKIWVKFGKRSKKKTGTE